MRLAIHLSVLPTLGMARVTFTLLHMLSWIVKETLTSYSKHVGGHCICNYSHASLNDGDTSWKRRRLAISSLCECRRVYLHKPRWYSLLHT